MKLKDYLEQEYNKCKEEYNNLKVTMTNECNMLNAEINECLEKYSQQYYGLTNGYWSKDFSEELYKKLKLRIEPFKEHKCLGFYIIDKSCGYIGISLDCQKLEKYDKIINTEAYNNIIVSLEHTKSLLVRIKDILDNKEHYVTINKKRLI